MRKKLLSFSLTSLLFFTSYPPVVNAATVKNGVICNKAGVVTKVGGKTYRCAKNPFLKPTQNTWTLRSCLTAYSLWQSSKKEYENWVDLAKLAGEQGQKTIEELKKSLNDLEITMKEEACKRGA